jgi:hypothetical protein
MNLLTHTLLPVLGASLYERSYSLENKRGAITNKQLMLIGFFGAAPDIINPHIYLEDRYSSWSHSILFWAILTFILIGLSLFKRKFCPWYMTFFLSFAYIAHIFCDAISGGICWLYPISQTIVGEYYVSTVWWFALDIFSFLFAILIFRTIPNLKKHKKKGVLVNGE